MRKLVTIEVKLLSRDWGLLGFGLVFPSLLLWALGSFMPGFLDPDPVMGGLRPVDVYTIVVLLLAYAMIGVTSIPAFLATYRHQRVLRRLRTTPVGPARLLVAQLVAHLLLAVLATVGVVLVARLGFNVPMSGSWAWFLLALLLAAAALFSLGLVIGALAKDASSAPVFGTFVMFGLMFFAGLWYPREHMTEALRRVSDFSPSGAAVDALSTAWFVGAPPASTLAVLAAYAVAVSAVAALTFRWD